MSVGSSQTDDQSSLFRPEVTAALSSQWLGAIRIAQPISSRIITLVSLIISVILILYVCIGSVTRKARVSGVTMPVTGMVMVASSTNGVLIRAHVQTGQHVKAGDLLFTISTERQQAAGELSALVLKQILQREQSLLTEKNLRQQLALDREASLKQRLTNLNLENAQLVQEIQLSTRRLELAQQTLDQYLALQQNGYVSNAQLRQKQEELIDIKSRIANQERNLTQLAATKLSVEADLQSVIKQSQTEIEQVRRAYSSQQQEKVENNNRQFVQITAAQDGEVTSINLPIGSSVQVGQSLASLIPNVADSQAPLLEAHVYVPSRTAGFIRPGQTVMIRYAAFPYQKFGLHPATVIEVSQTPLSPAELPPQLATTILSNAQQVINGFNSNEALYRVRLKLNTQNVSTYGDLQPLKPGMTFEANVLQEERKIWEWILEPVLALRQRSDGV